MTNDIVQLIDITDHAICYGNFLLCENVHLSNNDKVSHFSLKTAFLTFRCGPVFFQLEIVG
jgi:hypothetical protein